MMMTTLLALSAAFSAPEAMTCASYGTQTPTVMRDGATSEIQTGKIKSVDLSAKSFVLQGAGEGKSDTTIRTDDKTVFMLEGKVSTLAEVVKDGSTVTVTHAKGLATKVER